MRRPLRLNWGSRWDAGIIDCEPPEKGRPFGVKVPQVDRDGNEIAGIRMPEVVAPLGTFTGWRYRQRGATDALVGLDGMWVPFVRDEDEREGDSRLSIAQRYGSREAYLDCVAQAARKLVEERLMLREDVDLAVERAGEMYDWVMMGNRD